MIERERTCLECGRWHGQMPCRPSGNCEVDHEPKLSAHEACTDFTDKEKMFSKKMPLSSKQE